MIITRKKLFIISLVILIAGIICMICTNHVVFMDADEYKRFSDNYVSLMLSIFTLSILLIGLGGAGLMGAVIALVREHVEFDI